MSYYVILLILFIGLLACISARWAIQYFGLSCFEQIVFHLKVPLEGANPQFLIDWVKLCFIKALVIALVIAGVIYFVFYDIAAILSYGVLVVLLILAMQEVGIFGWVINLFRKTNFYEENYVDASKVKLTFPEKKRNLIHIYVESLENTYSSVEKGGNYKDDLLYPISDYALANVHFSHKENLGGAKELSGTGWTTGGLVGQSAGIPLLVPLNCKRFSESQPFFPGLTALGDILKAKGYQLEYLIGSDAAFGGRQSYFKDHGDFKIFDLRYAKEHGFLAKDYKEFWGYEDRKLFDFAKSELLELAQSEDPFYFAMLTVDTHHPYGYVDTQCKEQYSERLSNVIACDIKELTEFLDWLKQQDFYEDTTVVISGDHLSMAAGYIHSTYDKSYERTTFNCFLNSVVQPLQPYNREFVTLDMFPTVLASMGVTIEGDRLNLGTNLFSDKKTLVETYGFTYVDKELRKQSTYYKQHIMK